MYAVKLTCTFQLWKLADRKDYNKFFTSDNVLQLHAMFLHACDVFREDLALLSAKLSHCLLAALVSIFCADGQIDHPMLSYASTTHESPMLKREKQISCKYAPELIYAEPKGSLRMALCNNGFPQSVLNIPDHDGKVCENAAALGLNSILTLMSEGGGIAIFALE